MRDQLRETGEWAPHPDRWGVTRPSMSPEFRRDWWNPRLPNIYGVSGAMEEAEDSTRILAFRKSSWRQSLTV